MLKKKDSFKLSVREKEQSQRQLKVAGLVKGALVNALRKGGMIEQSLIGCPLTFTKISISPDLRVANCYFLPFNQEANGRRLLQAFEDSKYQIRKLVTKEISLKFSPELRFHYDHGFENSLIIDDLISKTKEEA